MMIYPAKRQRFAAAGAFLLGGLLAALLGTPSADRLVEPLVQLGQWLRALSLRSSAGNLGAWAIAIGLSCLPALGLLWKKRARADLLLILSGAEIFAMLYYLINPTRVSQVLSWVDGPSMAKLWGLMAAGCVAGTLICWALLRFLTILVKKPAEILPVFLVWTAVGYAFLLGLAEVQELLTSSDALAAGSTQQALLQPSRPLLLVLQVLRLVPDLFGVWMLLLAGRLALALETAPFAAETLGLAESVSAKSVLAAKVSLLLTVVGNTLQLLSFAKLLRVKMEIHIPLLTLLLCAILLLLCKYFRRAKEVHDDNASII